jgi:hypothetical protein
VQTLFIFLNGEIFCTLPEAVVLIEQRTLR